MKFYGFISYRVLFVLLKSQVVPVVKNPPAKAGDIEPSIQSLGWEDPLEEDMAASVFLPGESLGQRRLEAHSA